MRQNRKFSETYEDRARDVRRDSGTSRRGVWGRPVGAFVPRLTRPAFEKFGFPAAAIVTDWTAIVGSQLASYTIPERLKWPRTQGVMDGNAFPSETGGKGTRGATLLLRVDGPRAIEVQFMAGQIIERINVYFGYKAVSELRIVQAPLPRQNPGLKDIRSAEPSPETIALPAIEKPGLRQALQ